MTDGSAALCSNSLCIVMQYWIYTPAADAPASMSLSHFSDTVKSVTVDLHINRYCYNLLLSPLLLLLLLLLMLLLLSLLLLLLLLLFLLLLLPPLLLLLPLLLPLLLLLLLLLLLYFMLKNCLEKLLHEYLLKVLPVLEIKYEIPLSGTRK